MTILYDARGNEFGGQTDQIGGGTITDARTSSATLGAVNAEIVMDIMGKATAAFDVRTAAMNATLVFEGTVDGTNYISLPVFNPVTELWINSVVITTTAATIYCLDCSGLRRVRCRVSAYTSGNVVVTGRATLADFITYNKPMPITNWVTATAAVNTGATATLTAPGAGLYHYIVNIVLEKNYSVIGVAGAANVITTTNLVGSPAWTTEQAVGAAGTVVRVIDMKFAGNPLKSSVANTATTFVAGAQLQTIWRWNVSYYIGA